MIKHRRWGYRASLSLVLISLLSACAPLWQTSGPGPKARFGAAAQRRERHAGVETLALIRYANRLSTAKKPALKRAREQANVAFRRQPGARQRLRLALALSAGPASKADLRRAEHLLEQYVSTAKPSEGDGRLIPLALFLLSSLRDHQRLSQRLHHAKAAQEQLTDKLHQSQAQQAKLEHKLKALMQVEQQMNHVDQSGSTP